MGKLSMLLNVSDREETRIALVEDGRLEEYHIERASRETLVGNIYKGIVESIHSGLEAAFVQIGLPRNGFLHVSEAQYADVEMGRPPEREHGRRTVPLDRLLKPGDEIVVQVTRDGFGDKGPTLTTELSLPGRFLVLTATTGEIQVAKKVGHPGMRARLRRLVEDLIDETGRDDIPGMMVKAAAAGAEEREIRADFEHLVRMWTLVLQRALQPAPCLLYKEPGLVIRWIRDFFRRSIDEIVVDGQTVHQRVAEYLETFMPSYRERLRLHEGAEPLFHAYGIEKQIEELSQPIVHLPGGGRLHIEETEALTAIDVNSGTLRDSDPERLALRTNREAAVEAMRQLRLRDIGGIIVIDFIDMRRLQNVLEIEQTVHREAEKDRAQMTILPMSRFCLMEIARQKMRASVELISHEPCPACGGTGIVKSVETLGLDLLRTVKSQIERPEVSVIEIRLHPDVAAFLRERLGPPEEIEARHGKRIHLFTVREIPPNRAELTCYDPMGEKVVEEIR